MRRRLIFLLFIATLPVFLLSLSLSFLGTAHAAQVDCPETYIVQRGDTLHRIAQRFSSSVSELMSLNRGRIWSPNLIFAGQTLCLPASLSNSQVALEATYQYTPNDNEIDITLAARGGLIGKRVVFPLQAIEPIDTVSTTVEMREGIAAGPRPVLVGVRNEEPENSYTLVTLDREDILSSLRISGTLPTRGNTCLPMDVKTALGDETLEEDEVQVNFWMEGDDGIRIPFSTTHVDNLPTLPTIDLLERCYGGKEFGFALFPADSGHPDELRMLMVLSEEGFGPPGRGWRPRCSSWYGGRIYRWLRAWYGC